VSAIEDVVSICMGRKKITRWFEALTEYKAFRDASGLGCELEEAIEGALDSRHQDSQRHSRGNVRGSLSKD
jgi:hypothetical protein